MFMNFIYIHSIRHLCTCFKVFSKHIHGSHCCTTKNKKYIDNQALYCVTLWFLGTILYNIHYTYILIR